MTTLLAALTESVSPVISYRAIVADSLASGEPPSLPIAVRPLPIDKIAALAGVSRSTVQNALREARRVGLCRSDGAQAAGCEVAYQRPWRHSESERSAHSYRRRGEAERYAQRA